MASSDPSAVTGSATSAGTTPVTTPAAPAAVMASLPTAARPSEPPPAPPSTRLGRRPSRPRPESIACLRAACRPCRRRSCRRSRRPARPAPRGGRGRRAPASGLHHPARAQRAAQRQAVRNARTEPLLPHPPWPTARAASAWPGSSASGARAIVIDAGHGGHDPGSIGRGGLQEKDLVLDVALRLEKLVRSELGAEVVMTRGDGRLHPAGGAHRHRQRQGRGPVPVHPREQQPQPRPRAESRPTS